MASLFSSNRYSRWGRLGGRIIAAAGLFALLFQIVLAQQTHRETTKDKGPRAVGLLEFNASGKARLIPITIMIDNKFYDASAYKASPIPMALDSGTVYEALNSGVSQGLFTVKMAREGKATWTGEGSWKSAAQIQAEAARRKLRQSANAAAAKRNNDDQEGPPVLRRAKSAQSGPDAPPTGAAKTPPASSTAPAGSSESSGTASQSTTTAAAALPTPSPSTTSDEDDPDRPHLRRESAPQKMADEKVEDLKPIAGNPLKGSLAVASAPGPSAEVRVVAAISDAAGPEPRPYAFDIKPDEEQRFRNKMLALAAAEVAARAKMLASESQPAPAAETRRGRMAKAPQPAFENVELRVFDLSNSNEPVLILSAKAHMPGARTPAGPASALDYFVTVVAREDIYGDLHKALANVTDGQHLDVLPKLDLIDAVDVDGDGRGELLFRQVYDQGSAYVVYRVIGNQLWPLYQGAVG